MRVRLARWLSVFALVPALLALTCGSSYALYRCEMMQRVFSHCCCTTEAGEPATQDCVERGNCCSDETQAKAAPSTDLLRGELYVLSPVTVSLIPIAWLFPIPSTRRIGPDGHLQQAQGPPILLLKQSLLC